MADFVDEASDELEALHAIYNCEADGEFTVDASDPRLFDVRVRSADANTADNGVTMRLRLPADYPRGSPPELLAIDGAANACKRARGGDATEDDLTDRLRALWSDAGREPCVVRVTATSRAKVSARSPTQYPSANDRLKLKTERCLVTGKVISSAAATTAKSQPWWSGTPAT